MASPRIAYRTAGNGSTCQFALMVLAVKPQALPCNFCTVLDLSPREPNETGRSRRRQPILCLIFP